MAAEIVKSRSTLSNVHGKPTSIPTKPDKKVYTSDQLMKLSMKTGGKGGLPRNDQREFMSVLRLLDVKTPSEHKMLKIKIERCSELFEDSEEYFEEGPVDARKLVKKVFAYCIDISKLVQKSKEIHDIADSRRCRLKLGCDSGQQYLKVTLQNINIASNSVHYTLILAAGKVIESIENLRILFGALKLQSLSEFEDEWGISVDFKVAPMLWGIMGGKAKYPCPLCLWNTDLGLTYLPQEPRTLAHCNQMLSRLRTKFNNNRKKAIQCCSVEAPAVIQDEPWRCLKFPSLHIHLLTNDVIKVLKSRLTDEERTRLDAERKAAGVVESPYEGGTLQGNNVVKFVKAVKKGDIYIKDDQLLNVLNASDDLRHTCFGNQRQPGAVDAVNTFIDAWSQAGLGVGVKVHLVQHHLLPLLNQLREDEGLGVWSEQACESDNGVFKVIAQRYQHMDHGLVKAVEEHNFRRM